jgi:hypothetical protein
MPDHLTALGVLAALGVATAYVLSNGDSAWLWAASALLVVHWFGDSLDGTLARVRKSERPTYGYYLDHLVDALATAMIGIGLGLSPHMLLATGLVIGTSLIPDPPPELRIAPPSEFRTGRILYALPSGMVCRHVKFDNVTGEIGDLGTGPCEYADQSVTGGIRRPGMSNPRGFTWNR